MSEFGRVSAAPRPMRESAGIDHGLSGPERPMVELPVRRDTRAGSPTSHGTFDMRTSTRFLLCSLLALPLGVTAVHAQTALSGLGQPSTSAVGDVSSSANYHVYVFARGGTRYIQVNDAGGAVRGAFAVTAYKAVGLPIGSDASRLATPDEPVTRVIREIRDKRATPVIEASPLHAPTDSIATPILTET